jgi:hypothetical protein
VVRLLHALREVGAEDEVAVLLARDPAAHASIDNPEAVAGLLRELRKVKAGDQVVSLTGRAAAHAPTDDAVTDLLSVLREVGAEDEAAVLAERAVTDALLGNSFSVLYLLEELRESEAAVLIRRLPAAGNFDLFRELDDHRNCSSSGGNPTGAPPRPGPGRPEVTSEP